MNHFIYPDLSQPFTYGFAFRYVVLLMCVLLYNFLSLCLFAFNKTRLNCPASNISGVQLAYCIQHAYLGINLILITVILMQLCNQVWSQL